MYNTVFPKSANQILSLVVLSPRLCVVFFCDAARPFWYRIPFRRVHKELVVHPSDLPQYDFLYFQLGLPFRTFCKQMPSFGQSYHLPASHLRSCSHFFSSSRKSFHRVLFGQHQIQLGWRRSLQCFLQIPLGRDFFSRTICLIFETSVCSL